MAEIVLSGPWFDDGGSITSDLAEQCVHAVSTQARVDWMDTLKGHFQHATGAYESHMNVQQGSDQDVVNDEASVYGPWLEGTGSRNAPRTRFEGYHSMQDVTDALPDKIEEICRPHVDKAIGELNA